MSLRARPSRCSRSRRPARGGGRGCGGDDDSGSSSSGGNAGGKKYKIGVSNTLVGNGWREEMICAVKAQAWPRSRSPKVLVHNVNGDASAQIAGIRNLISSGANAIVINPARP
jgi:ribose transport system substrate-binding protein